MNDEILNKIVEIRRLFENSKLYKEYLDFKKEIYKNKKYISLLNEIDYYKNCTGKDLEKAKELYSELNNEPLIKNYKNIKEILHNDIDTLRGIIKQ